MIPLLIFGAVFFTAGAAPFGSCKVGGIVSRGIYRSSKLPVSPVSFSAWKGAFSSGGGFGVRGGRRPSPSLLTKLRALLRRQGLRGFFAVPARAGSGSKRRFCQFTETSTPEKAEPLHLSGRKRGRRVRGNSVRPNLRSSVWRLRDFAGTAPLPEQRCLC